MKNEKEVFLIDVVITDDSRLSYTKFAEKQNKYVDLKIELSQLWHSRVYIVPIIIGALEFIAKALSRMLEKLIIIILLFIYYYYYYY